MDFTGHIGKNQWIDKDYLTGGLVIPYQELSLEALQGVIQELRNKLETFSIMI